MDWATPILAAAKGGLTALNSQTDLKIQDERKREEEARTAERERISRQALFDDFIKKKEWETAFDIKNAGAKGKAAADQKQAEYDASTSMREQEDARALALKKAQQTEESNIRLNEQVDQRTIDAEKRKAATQLQTAIAGRAPQQPNEGVIVQGLMQGKTPEEQMAIAEKFYGRGATAQAKNELREITGPDGITKIQAIWNPTTQTLTPVQPGSVPQEAGPAGPQPVPPPEQRVVGQQYRAPSGAVATWTPQGWQTGEPTQTQPAPAAQKIPPPEQRVAPPIAPAQQAPVVETPKQQRLGHQEAARLKADLPRLDQVIQEAGRSGNIEQMNKLLRDRSQIVEMIRAAGVSV